MSHLPARLTVSVLSLIAGGLPLAAAAPAHADDPPQPPNDMFAQATVIGPDAGAGEHGVDLTGNNEGATAETGEPNHGDSEFGSPFHSVWWSWTAPRSGAASLATCGSTFDTRLGVYTGSSVDALTTVAQNNDSTDGPCPGLLSYVTFDAVEGTTYHFAVDTNGSLNPSDPSASPRGPITLHFKSPPAPPTPPANDNFAQATVIEPDAGAGEHGVDLTGNNTHATAEPGEPQHGGSSSGEPPFNSVWWSWTAPRSGAATLATCGSSFDTRLGVYTGSSVGALSTVAGNNDSTDGPCPGRMAYVAFDAVGGTTYHFAVDTAGPLDSSGSQVGPIALHFTSTAASGDDKTTPGTVVPVAPVKYTMPDLEPSKHNRSWRFSDNTAANKALGHAMDVGQLYPRVVFTRVQSPPSEYRDELYKQAPGTAILKTRPSAGATIRSSQAHRKVIRIFYWSPLYDPDYRDYVQKQEELKRKHCKLLDAHNDVLRRMLLALTYDEASRAIKNKQWGQCKVWEEDNDNNPNNNYNNRIFRDYVMDVQKHPDQNGIGLTVVRPKTPDFAIVLREDPRYLKDSSRTSLVEGSSGWSFPAAPHNTTQFTAQVVERTTGRLVAGADVRLWYIDNRGNVKTLLDHATNGDGDLAVNAHFPRPMTLYISATVTKGSMQMEATRQVEVRDLGNQIETPCGRVLTRSGSSGAYVGDATQLQHCRQMQVVPGNLGDGRGNAAPHTALPGETDAITIQNGQIVTGTYNAVDISGENIIVGDGPGMLILGGGNVESYTTGHPLNMLSHLLTDLHQAVSSGVSNISTSMSTEELAKIQATKNLLDQIGYAVNPASLISDKGLGVIASGGGNLISDKGLGVIAAGGGNLLGAGNGSLLATNFTGVIASGGGNWMPMNGGAVIASGGGN